MKGDFTRWTFDPSRHFLRVLMQQGRVQLDADWNEQAAILLHYLQSLAADLIGEHGGPDGGFLIDNQPGNFQIGAGHYYVDGLLCENELQLSADGKPQPLSYFSQPDYPRDPDQDKLPDPPFLVYLDVWERLLTYVQDDSLREVALGGPDTAARARLVWQARVTNRMPDGKPIPTKLTADDFAKLWPMWLEQWQPLQRGLLRARARLPEDAKDPCITDPEARYRGAENQLYRVEIHAGSLDAQGEAATPTFKWSRENGSVVFPVRSISGMTVVLESLGRDAVLGLKVGDWVELRDDTSVLMHEIWPLMQVESIDPVAMSVMLAWPADVSGMDLPEMDEEEAEARHALLRRWDHQPGVKSRGGAELKQGALVIVEGQGDKAWLNLEDGVQVQFQPGQTYRSGDFWLIPARTATGDVEWPGEVDDPLAMPPNGVQHHYAPLALILTRQTGAGAMIDLRHTFKPIWQYK